MKLSSLPSMAMIALALALALIVVTVPLALKAQWMFAIVTIVAAMVLSRSASRRTTLVLAILSLVVSTRYIFWRTTATLEFENPLGAALGFGLYLAELYAWVILALGVLQTAWPLEREAVEIQGEPHEWPTVDVYIPTYNESLDIVRTTVLAAQDMDYPHERFQVHLLDDGKRPEFRAFARSVGCGYITRSDNNHAKAGNLNAAMSRTEGSLIAIFDCDHVPTRGFLQMTVGWFQREEKLALVQTPHHFYSPDPVQRNLGTVRDLPGEGDLFYGAVQRGNDLWDAAFFCGSCAIIRRAALADTGGFAFETVTEDAHTALRLQRMGWSTAYLGMRLSAGLATERLVVHIGQRIRWARGMSQILRIDNPLFGRGLKLQQRLCYLNAMLHFQFPLPRIVFLTSPLAYLIFGQNIIRASAPMIFAYAAAHLYCSQVSGGRLQGGDRRPFWGEVYETILAFHLVKPTLFTLFRPHGGKFNVTDKGQLLDQTQFDIATVRPHLICIGLVIFGVVFAAVKFFFFPHLFNIQGDTLLLNTVWAVFSLVILLAAVSVGRETRQVREHIRIPARLPATLYFGDGHVVAVETTDISMGGLGITAPANVALADRQVTHVALPMGDETLTLPVETLRMTGRIATMRFRELDMLQQRQLVRTVMGRNDAWEPDAPRQPVSTLSSLRDILGVDFATLKRLLGLNRAERRRERARIAATPKVTAVVTGLVAALLLFAGAAPRPAQAQTAPAPAAAAASEAAPAAGGSRQERLTFRDLRVRSAVRLAGTRGEISIPFGLRSNEVVTNANLTLTLAWSPAMLGDLSQLVVILNGEAVQTLRLTPDRAAGQRVAIAVNPALFLPGDNQLNLRLVGHYTRDCEDPFHSSLWANISNTRSAFDLTIQTLPIVPDLARLPAPFFDRSSNLPLNLPFVFASAPTNGELQAAAGVASWFGRLASYRGFAFKPSYGRIPSGNAIVFMRPGMRIGSFAPTVSGPSSMVIRNPSDPFGDLLLIMGRDEREMQLAAAALATGRGTTGGASAAFDGVRIPTYPRYGAPRWLRSDRAVQLGEILDPTSLQGIGLPPGPLTAGFRTAPDLFFWPRTGAALDLRYRYPSASWLDRRGSRLDVSINNQYLRTMPLTGDSWWKRLAGGQDGATSNQSRVSVELPSYNLFGQNELVFDYNLVLANKKRCEGTLPDNVRVAIDPTSAIDLTHAYHALRMPSLASFANAGYPFTISPDLAETVVVIGASPDADTVEAFLALMGRFGDSTGAAATALTVTQAVDGEQLADRDILVIGLPKAGNAGTLFAGAPIQIQNGRLLVSERNPIERVFGLFSPYGDSDVDETNAFLASANRFTGFASFQSPYDKDRTVVAMLSTDPTDLPGLAEGLAEEKINAQIQGDLSVLTGDRMRSFAVGQTYWSGSLPAWMRVAWWFSERPLLMALSGLLVALLLAGPLYLVLMRQQKRRLRQGNTA